MSPVVWTLLDLLSGAVARRRRRGHRTVVPVFGRLPRRNYLAGVTMADTKGANISRMVLKQAGRAKEKVGTG